MHFHSNWHVAHEIPHSRWPRLLAWLGRDADWNLGVAHAECNLRAGARPMSGWQSLSLRTKLLLVGAAVAAGAAAVAMAYLL